MSASNVVVKRYANALFLSAKEKNIVAQVEADLQLVSAAMVANPEFISLLTHPGVNQSDKHQLLDSVFQAKVQPIVLDAMHVLCARRRANVLGELSASFTKIAGKELGQAEAHIMSAHALSDKEISDIESKFSQLLGKKVKSQYQLDSSLIGGIQVRIGDTLYDGSIAGKLARLGKSLQESQAL